jgi:hypothetical protein
MPDFRTDSIIGGAVFLTMLLAFHFIRRVALNFPNYRIIIGSLAAGGVLYLGTAAFIGFPVGLYTVAFYTLAFGICVFILVSEALLRGGARKLNARMGNKWIKRFDYIYLIIGAIGAVLSVNRLPVVANKVAGLDLLGPMLVIAAIAIRIIKTRAELNDWDKL